MFSQLCVCMFTCMCANTLCTSFGVRVSSLGLLWQLRPSDVEVELLAHTRNVISKDLEEETGLHTGWIQNGGLFIASNKQRLDEYKRLMSVRIAWFWAVVRKISPQYIKKVKALIFVYSGVYFVIAGVLWRSMRCETSDLPLFSM